MKIHCRAGTDFLICAAILSRAVATEVLLMPLVDYYGIGSNISVGMLFGSDDVERNLVKSLLSRGLE